MMCAISDDLPEPRPPLQTTFNILGLIAAFQTERKACGISSDSLSFIFFTYVIYECNSACYIDFLFISPHCISLSYKFSSRLSRLCIWCYINHLLLSVSI